ncbi:aminotransferase class IV [Candidatus Poseidonia alphae]|nr:aminotransferase class IV [Candidatus Poseidonia alphae]MDB2636919.1 aminotransferase class IV [Candidatus Poseidonia alphae]
MSQVRGPRDEVFTTAVVNSEGKLADAPAHLKRMKDHAKRLRIALPDEFPATGLEGKEMGLVRLSYSSQTGWKVQYRAFTVRNEALDAISTPAPRWNPKTNGCKHGDWAPYNDARAMAEKAGCDVALFVHEHALVDGDRGTPLLLDEDGTVWLPADDDGGVDGITASFLEARLPEFGLPVMRGRLNERLVARCHELVVVGSGLGACRVDSIDGERVGQSTVLSEQCQKIINQHFTQEATWS